MSNNNRHRREENIVASTPCPTCAAPIGQRCREGVLAHDARRGVEDLRQFLGRVHTERRVAWVASKPKESNAT